MSLHAPLCKFCPWQDSFNHVVDILLNDGYLYVFGVILSHRCIQLQSGVVQWCWYLVFVFGWNNRLVFTWHASTRSRQDLSLVLSIWHSTNCTKYLTKASLFITLWARELMNSVWSSQLSTLHSTSISNLPCWTALMTVFLTRWKTSSRNLASTAVYPTLTSYMIVS